jgi:hypothetical protein
LPGQAQPHRTRFTAEALARKLAAAARKNALDAHYRSPFIVEAARAGVLPLWRRVRPRGGKLDVRATIAPPFSRCSIGARRLVGHRKRGLFRSAELVHG